MDEHYYISNGGDDGNSGTSPDDPWATLINIPGNRAAAVHFQRGGSWTVTNTVQPAMGAVYTTYDDGERPLLYLNSPDTTRIAAVSPRGNNLVEGITVKGNAVLGFAVSTEGNVISDCEVDGAIEGEEFGDMQLGFSIRGENNKVIGNYVHDLSGLSGDTGNYNTSGGSITLPPVADDFYSNAFSPSAPWGVDGDSLIATDPGFLDDFRLAPQSQVIDTGTPDAFMTWTDYDGNPVPCGAAPDIGVLEYCP